MIKSNKKFFTGVLVGVVAVIWLNTVINGAISTYRRFVARDITVNEKVDLIFAILDHVYVGEVDRRNIENGLFRGMLYGVGDRYTSYMSYDEFKRFMEITSGTYVGIGAGVIRDEEESIVIVSLYQGSPAYNAGLLPGDVIREIDGIDVTSYDLSSAVNMMRGPEGTAVILSVYRRGENETLDIEIVRQKIEVPTISYEMLEENIGLIRISGFEKVTYSQFLEAYEGLVEKGMEGLIIDVRNNPGGLLDVVVNIANLIVPEGIIVYTEDTNGNRRVQYSNEEHVNIPLAVLINGNSASASEVLAGAIKDHGVGIIVGEQSFGKGLVQDIFPLPDGSAVKVTIATYYTPNGISIHGEGLTPNYVVPMDETLTLKIGTLDIHEDIQLEKAFQIVYDKIAE